MCSVVCHFSGSVNVTGSFDVTFNSDNSISGSGFYARFVVFNSSGAAGPALPGRGSSSIQSM